MVIQNRKNERMEISFPETGQTEAASRAPSHVGQGRGIEPWPEARLLDQA